MTTNQPAPGLKFFEFFRAHPAFQRQRISLYAQTMPTPPTLCPRADETIDGTPEMMRLTLQEI